MIKSGHLAQILPTLDRI